MKLKFEPVYRSLLLFVVLSLAWSLWASAQTNTNKPSLTTTNQPSALVEKVARLEEHPLTFGFERVRVLREKTVFGEPLWKYGASLVYILLAFYASKLFDFLTRVWLRKLASRTKTALDDLAIGLLRGPVKVVTFVVLLNIGLSIFDWSPRAQLFLSKASILIVAAALTYLAVKITELLLDVWRRRHGQGEKFDHQLFSALRTVLNTFVIIVAVLITAQNLGVNITAARIPSLTCSARWRYSSINRSKSASKSSSMVPKAASKRSDCAARGYATRRAISSRCPTRPWVTRSSQT